jgi:DNA polymerase III epsilon subunit-like protein
MQPFSYENITDEALGKHGISVEQMKTFPEAKMVYEQIRGFLAANSQNGNKITLVGFNVKFDILMLEALFKHFDPQDSVFKFCSHKYIDVYEQIKMLKEIGYFPELKNLKLESFLICLERTPQEHMMHLQM